MIKSLLVAGFGGFIGTILRFLVSRYFQLHFATVFPWGTLIVNIVGCFVIGIFLGFSEKGELFSQEWRLFFTVGICGGFTTFSTFSIDAVMLLENRELFRFASYSALSFFLGITASILGRNLIKLW